MSKIPPSIAAVGQPLSPEESRSIFAAAAERGERNVRRISDIVEANSLEVVTITKIESVVRHGAKFIDLHIRKDGVEYSFQADWLARLFRAEKI